MKKAFKIIAIAAPILIGIIVSICISTEIFNKWSLIKSPTEQQMEFFTLPKDPEGYPLAVKECNKKGFEFLFFVNKPKSIASCVEVIEYYIDGNCQITFVKDNNGAIWQWKFLSSVVNNFYGYYAIALGGILSGIIALIIFRKRLRKRTKEK